jgi:hypothetical protein
MFQRNTSRPSSRSKVNPFKKTVEAFGKMIGLRSALFETAKLRIRRRNAMFGQYKM